jgi:hypothetical protein
MPDPQVQLKVYSRLLEKDGKFATLLHWGDGEPIVHSGFIYDTLDAARAAVDTVLDRSLEVMQRLGIDARMIGGPDA